MSSAVRRGVLGVEMRRWKQAAWRRIPVPCVGIVLSALLVALTAVAFSPDALAIPVRATVGSAAVAYAYDGVIPRDGPSAEAPNVASSSHWDWLPPLGRMYDHPAQLARASVPLDEYRSAPNTARAPIRVNLGGEGEVARAINVQPARIGGNVDAAFENAQRVAAQSRQPVVMAEGNRLPFRSGSVDEVWTNNVPIGKGGGYFGPSFDPDEIFRVLRPGGSWLGNSAL